MGCCLSVQSATSPLPVEIATSKNTTSPLHHHAVVNKKGLVDDHKSAELNATQKLDFDKAHSLNKKSSVALETKTFPTISASSHKKDETSTPTDAKSIWKAREEESKKQKEKSERKPSPQKKSANSATSNSTNPSEIKSSLAHRMSNLDTSKIMNQYKTYPTSSSSKPTDHTDTNHSLSERSTQSENTDTSEDLHNPTLSRASITNRSTLSDSAGEINSSRRKNPTKKAFNLSNSELDAVAEFTASMKNSNPNPDEVENVMSKTTKQQDQTNTNMNTVQVPPEISSSAVIDPVTAVASERSSGSNSSALKIPTKSDISKLLDKKRRTDPLGLIKAQSKGSLGEFLADDLRAAGFNPNAISFG